ncbi:inosine/xanthosine triphosphatase [Candidatus Gottesmanbacteria bacterium]|nr:inosine/xanthosine triphosphatase [Candidatus Gottesmanbacteria bacterium]
MIIAVGSKNPVKIEAVRLAFAKVWPQKKWKIQGVEVSSGVSKQPMSDAESIRGARNRAQAAIKKLAADFGVGIEGGLEKIEGKWFDCGWAVVIDTNDNEGVGATLRMETPPTMMHHVRQGKELGEVSDLLFNRKNSKQAEGQFGLMTDNAVTRTSGYVDGIIAALARFIHPKLFEE